jgi:hypothetical protein
VRRSVRYYLRGVDHAKAKRVNGKNKTKECARRDERMVATIKAGSLPYTADVMSWISRQTGIKSSRVTEADLKALVA